MPTNYKSQIVFQVKTEDLGQLKKLTRGIDKVKQAAGVATVTISRKSRTMNSALKKNDALVRKVKEGFEKQGKSAIVASKSISKVSKAAKKLRYDFQGQWLSIMFFGMAIERVFGGIAKSGIGAFEKIMEGTDELVRNTNSAYVALNAVGASMDYLKFSVGNALATALEPFVNKLIKLNDAFARFANRHPKIVSAILLIGAAFGAVLSTVGMVKLGVRGLNFVLGGISLSKDAPNITAFFKGLPKLIKNIKLGGLTSSFNNFNTAIKGINVSSISTKLLELTNSTTLLGAALKTGVIAGIISMIIWIGLATYKMGGFKEFLKSFARGFIRVMNTIGAATYATFERIKSDIASALLWLVNKTNDLINKINEMGGVFGHTIPSIPTSKLEKWQTTQTTKSWYQLYADRAWEDEANLERIKALQPSKGYLESGNIINPLSWVFEGNGQSQNVNFAKATNLTDLWSLSPWNPENSQDNNLTKSLSTTSVNNNNQTYNVTITIPEGVDNGYDIGQAFQQQLDSIQIGYKPTGD